MTRRAAVAAVIAGGLALAAVGPGSAQDLFYELVPPALILADSHALGLGAEQRQAIEGIVGELHSQMRPLVRQMREEQSGLVALLKVERPDEAAVVAQFEKLSAVETEMKLLNLQMTVRSKRVLTAEQQEKALSLQRNKVRWGPAAGTESVHVKLQRVRDGLEQWKREGRDVTRLRALWERFREAEDKGFYRQARQALDEAIALLEAPPARD
jgi:heavy-metal resistance protein